MNRQEGRTATQPLRTVAPPDLAALKQSLEAAKQGQALFNLGRYAEAVECFNVFVKLNPDVAPLYQTRGLCFQRLGRLDEAQADFERSIALNPGEAETHKNLGTLHSKLGRMEQAFASFDRALALRPNFPAALNEKARALWGLQLLDEAFAVFHRSLALDPGNADTIWNLALLQMLTGDFEHGWRGREARWKASSLGLSDRGFGKPLWLDDQPLDGKTILLHADEALGDSIQFARYAPMVAALGAKVVLEVKPAVQSLLADVPGVAACVDRSSTPSLAFDLHCPLGSLPLAFGTRLETIPLAEGFLPAPEAARVKTWEDRLGPRTRFRVGLVWSGDPNHKNDHNRSIGLRALAPLLDCDVQFVSLQKGIRDQDRAVLAGRPDIIDLTDQLADFSDTAALVSCLDLVISVDTSVVHLTGALGISVWTLLPFNPDWRWLLNRDDSPWYSSMRLFRQPKRDDWASVVDGVRRALEERVAAWRSGAEQRQSRRSSLRPQDAVILAEAHNKLGILHAQLGRFEQALVCFDRALDLRPNLSGALSNKALVLLNLQLLDEAFTTFRKALAVDPNNTAATYNLATLQLLTGDFERGWAGRETRWTLPVGLLDRDFSQPLWLGDEPIAGKTILLHADEGLGDAIQFARYAPMVAALGARIIMELQPPIAKLLAGVSGVENCVGRPSAASLPFDLHCPLGTLPFVFRTGLDSIPSPEPYLPAPSPAQVKIWQDRLGDRNRLRVGLAWSGNPAHKNDRDRSIALGSLAPLLDCDVQFVSLQKDVRDQDRALLDARKDIVDVTDQLTDFTDTAALVSCLDLVISVDTSVVHLTGALGIPVWTMLPFNPDWRWLLSRDDSPWYRSMRLFRQPKPGDWASVVDDVRRALLSFHAK
jgi:Flp pilus assembly protein TadD